MGNIETATKFSRLKSISSIEDNYVFIIYNYAFTSVIFFQVSLKN